MFHHIQQHSGVELGAYSDGTGQEWTLAGAEVRQVQPLDEVSGKASQAGWGKMEADSVFGNHH